MTDLFRPQAAASQRQKLYGSVLLARPLSHALLTALLTSISTGIVIFFFIFGFSRKENVVGVVVPEQGVARIFPQQPGTVIERKVNDGDIVHERDVLFILSSERSSLQGETQSAISQGITNRISKLEREIEHQRSQAKHQFDSLRRKRKEVESLIERMGHEVALQQRRVSLAESAATRYADLQRSSFISESQLQDKSAELLEQQSRLRALERTHGTLRLDLMSVENELEQQPEQAQREASMLEREAAELRQELAESESRRQGVIRAPRHGYVTAIAAEPGQWVLPSQALAAVIPTQGALEVELYAPTTAVGFVRAGSEVFIRYRAFPFQKFGQHRGRIREVSKTPLQPHEISIPLARDPTSTDPLYRIRAEIDSQAVLAYGREEQLKAGMQVDASIVLEQRKLYEWVIEPLLSVTGRL